MCTCTLLSYILSLLKRLWHWICRTCCRCAYQAPSDIDTNRHANYNNEEVEAITYIQADGLTAREIMNRISMINMPSLRKILATRMIPYFDNSDTKPPNTVTDLYVNDKDSIGYATYSLQSINNKYNLHLAYFYSNAHSRSSAFHLLHQRINATWPGQIKFEENNVW